MLKRLLNRNHPNPSQNQDSEDLATDLRQPANTENGIALDDEAPQDQSLREKVNDVNVEAGLPLEQTGGKNNMTKMAVLAVALLGMGIAVAGIIAFSSGGDDEAVAAQQQELEKVANIQQKDFSTEKLDFGQEQIAVSAPVAASQTEPPIQEAPPISTSTEVAQPVESAPPPTQTPPPQTTEAKETPRERKLRGDVVINYIQNGQSGSTHANHNYTTETATLQDGSLAENDTEQDNPSEQNHLTAKLTPSITPSVQAKRRADLTYLLAKGTNIPCTLDTQIITTHAGITRCLVTKDVYSANGKVLLLERGTKIIGEQRSAMLHGQARVFVLWNEAETPKGVNVSLASIGAGKLGASGHGARVKYHFWQRFGGSIMISLIGDLGDYYSNRAKDKGQSQNISFENSSEAAQDMATEALKNSINIPPTAYINHGTLINIMVARDVDFSEVYEVVKPYEMF